MQQVTVTHVPAIPLAVVRRRARPSELSKVVPEGCGLVWNFVRAHSLKAGRNVAVYLNANIDLEIGVEIASDFAAADEVVRSSTPAGLVASAVHLGPYQGLATSHDAIRAWCGAHGYRPTGPSWEIYGHWQPEWNADPSGIRTEVFYQVTQM